MNNLEELMKKYPISTEIPKEDLRDYKFSEIDPCVRRKKEYDDIVLKWNYPMYNQGNVGECQGCALANQMNYVKNVANNMNDMFSPSFIYGYRPDNSYLQNTGLNTNDGYRTAIKIGNVKFKDFPVQKNYPYIKQDLDRYGLNNLVEKASKYKMEAYVSVEVEDVKEFIHTYHNPLNIVVMCYENFYDCLKNNIFPSEGKGNCIGSHAMTCIGEKNGMLVIVNSWGGNKLFYIDKNSSTIRRLHGFTDKQSIQEQASKNYGWEKVNKLHPSGTQIKWKYLKQNGVYAYNEWIQLGKDEFYYIGSDNYAYDGQWLSENNGQDWYYLLPNSCKLAYGWFKVDGVWYYGNPNHDGTFGRLLSGWITWNGYKYILDERHNGHFGEMLIGKQVINGRSYIFDNSGKLIK